LKHLINRANTKTAIVGTYVSITPIHTKIFFM